jgi:ankyrin repeat protein
MGGDEEVRAAFIEAATWHGSLERAEAIRAEHPEIIGRDLHTAAILGDDATVTRLLADDPGSVSAKAPPYGGDALVYLCLSKYLARDDGSRGELFVRAARALLDAGADPNTGFRTSGVHAAFESALYGAAGVAHHPGLTRLLLERGADPNDEEVPYHAPEVWDNRALEELIACGRLTRDSLITMLIRKADCHDGDGMRLLLDAGADVNGMSMWGKTVLHQALLSDNALSIIEQLLDRGADATIEGTRHDVHRPAGGLSSVALAARRGRGDVLAAMDRRGISTDLQGAEALIAACARGDAAAVADLARREPALVDAVKAEGGRLLALFAGNGNTAGVGLLLSLGIPVDDRFDEGDGYFDESPGSTALHVAAWRARPDLVRFLIARGADVNAEDGRRRTPLMLAVKACVDSYWTERRTPESVAALLGAGATTRGIAGPCGYAEVDALLGYVD